MYRPKYLSLSEAVGVIAKRLAYSSEQSGVEEARGQLIAALYDGAIRSEGVLREPPVEPDPSEPEPAIPPERKTISRAYWKNENFKRDMPLLSHNSKWLTNTQVDRYGRITSDLDAVTVRWDENCITWEEDDSGDYVYEDIHVITSDVDAAFPIPSDTASVNAPTPPPAPPDDALLDLEGPTYSTGAPGRPTSAHLVEIEMRCRFAAGEQAPSMRREAEHLSEWLRAAHPQAARMSPKTIYNRLGGLYRELAGKFPK